MNTQNSIAPQGLESDYIQATARFQLAQNYANLLLQQPFLELPVDAGLASLVRNQQQSLKTLANNFDLEVMPGYIKQIASASGFTALWQAYKETDRTYVKNAFDNPMAQNTAVQATNLLAEHSGEINAQADLFANNINGVNTTLQSTIATLERSLDRAISDMGVDAEFVSASIDELKSSINQNINDIVEGGEKTGKAVTDLGIGILTTIAADSGSAAKGTGTDKKAGESKGTSVPSTEFVALAIKGASEGAAETAKARADLNANNEKLADAYHKLAELNGLTAVAKVVSVQNSLYIGALKEIGQSIPILAQTWGTSPLTPPGSGISLGFHNFALQIQRVKSTQEAEQLAGLIGLADVGWTSLSRQLNTLKRTLSGV